jgi:hypothetical protein
MTQRASAAATIVRCDGTRPPRFRVRAICFSRVEWRAELAQLQTRGECVVAIGTISTDASTPYPAGVANGLLPQPGGCESVLTFPKCLHPDDLATAKREHGSRALNDFDPVTTTKMVDAEQ